MNRGDRIEAPLVRRDGGLAATDWDEALRQAAELIAGVGGEVLVLASPAASTEALYLARRVAGERFRGAFRVARVAGEAPLAGVPNLALREERAPNVRGASALGYAEEFDRAVAGAERAAVVLVLDEALHDLPADALARAPAVIYLGTTLPEAARGARVVLPITNVAEEDGTYVNRDGRVQRFMQARGGPGMARPAWWALGGLLGELGREPVPGSAADAFAMLAAEVETFGGLSYTVLGTRGARLGQGAPAGATA
jgi:NADH-quinone oxidoreductase subunit G